MNAKLSEILNGNWENYTAPFLWLHNEDDSLIINELQRIYDCGIRAICVESRTHEEFCNEDWWSDMRLIMDFCKEHDMYVWILDDKHFPSGYANGYFEAHPELQQWSVTEYHVDVAGPVKEGAVYSTPWAWAPGDEILGIFACRRIPDSITLTGEIIDITDNQEEGYVYFDLPEGMWRIVFLVKSHRGLNEWAKKYSDKLNPEATDIYIREVHQKHWDNLSEYFGNTFLGFFSDEPGFLNNTANQGCDTLKDRRNASFPYSEAVREHFKKVYGEDGMRNLMSLWFDFESLPYEDYKVEYMNLITDEYERCFTKKIADWCHEHGVKYIGHVIEDNNLHYETIRGAGHYFKALRTQDMSGIDVVLQQIVPGLTECKAAIYAQYKENEPKFFYYTLAKLASSLAHITPHMNKKAMCEIFGAYGWAEGTKIMKYLSDHMLVRGINYFVPHAFSPKPNDPDCPPNFYATGENPQFKYFKYIISHINRTCDVFDGSTHINTSAILYDAESAWSGDNFMRLDEVSKVLYDGQLDFDIIPPYALSDIKDGYINGEKYNLILVPETDYLREEVRCALKNSGVKVITVSDKADKDFESVSLSNLCAFMRENDYWDILPDNSNMNLRYYHALKGNTHIYMFSNEDIVAAIETELILKDFKGGEYVIYDAFMNKAERYRGDKVKIKLAPYNSCMVIFGEDFSNIGEGKENKITEIKEITPEFNISLSEKDGEEFSPYKTTKELKSINARGEKPLFSGNIKYKTTINIDTADGIILNLGEVGETAELFVNGKNAGLKLFPPYRFDITEFINMGENEIEVLVTNTLGYRIHDMFSKYLMLPPTGILGPITIEGYNR